MDARELWAALRRVTDLTIAIADDITVALVANWKAEISDAYSDRSTEYLSDGEASGSSWAEPAAARVTPRKFPR